MTRLKIIRLFRAKRFPYNEVCRLIPFLKNIRPNHLYHLPNHQSRSSESSKSSSYSKFTRNHVYSGVMKFEVGLKLTKKQTPAQVICNMSKNTFFVKHLRKTDSALTAVTNKDQMIQSIQEWTKWNSLQIF